MRTRVFALTAALIAVLITSTTAAEASHWRRHGYYGSAVTVEHYRYYPRYYHVYNDYEYAVDPYAYRYTPRSYYPYYNSDYWRPAGELRWRPRPVLVLPRYYQAWGYPRPVYAYKWRHRHHRHW